MSLPQRFGDFATWTGSIGTVLAFGVAFYGLHKERGHRLRREMADRLRAQREHADRVPAWFAGSEIVVTNESGHPIHDVVVSYTPAPHSPGETRLNAPEPPDLQIPTLLFTDVRGDRWHRDPGKPPTTHLEEPPSRGNDPR